VGPVTLSCNLETMTGAIASISVSSAYDRIIASDVNGWVNIYYYSNCSKYSSTRVRCGEYVTSQEMIASTGFAILGTSYGNLYEFDLVASKIIRNFIYPSLITHIQYKNSSQFYFVALENSNILYEEIMCASN
jgi:hypothetical protein